MLPIVSPEAPDRTSVCLLPEAGRSPTEAVPLAADPAQVRIRVGIAVGHATDVHLEDLAGMAEQVVEIQDAVGRLVGAADEDRAAAAEGRLTVGARRAGRPSSAMPSAIMRCSYRR
ncbi:hypothetical protein [Streptomyces sp. R44]|uniref:Uncharacterized protein n=1 Tax=Streptomyces sp. R44 TaxID=3238633 RepID=A0AB39SLN9_9ACTN